MKDICRIILSSFIVLLNIYTSRGDEDSIAEESGVSVCDQPKDGVISTGLKSKFFHAPEKSLNYQQMKDFCAQKNLKIAEITSQADVDHMDQFIEEISPGEKYFMLDYMADESGKYKDSTGQDMIFQNFEPGNDLKFDGAKKCVALYLFLLETPKMVKVSCDDAVLTLCQYNHGDECLKTSAQETIRAGDEMKSIGMVEEAEFFASETKKTQSEAAETCSAADKSLLVIKSQMVNERVFAMVREFAASHEIDPRTEIWTNGALKNGVIQWQYGRMVKSWEDMAASVDFMWLDDDALQDSKKACITYSADPSTAVDGIVVSTFAIQSCDMPHYFICYSGVQPEDAVDSNAKGEKINATTTTESTNSNEETETEAPTTLPPFFAEKSTPGPSISTGTEDPGPSKPSCYKISELPTITVEPNSPMTNEELLNLIKFARVNHIEENGIDIPYKTEGSWRKEFVNLLAKIFSKVCPGALIPKEYINNIIVLVSVYLNSLKPEHATTKVGDQVWNDMMTPLKECERNTTPISMTSKGAFANDWVLPEENRIHKILIPRETVDHKIPLNTIIDHFWSMYSLSMGNCMDHADSPTDWAVNYFFNFNSDYVIPLMNAWTTPLNFDIGVLIGDFDLETMNYNIRACTTAAYMRSGIPDRQLARPIDMSGKNDMNSMNEKTGQPVMNALT